MLFTKVGGCWSAGATVGSSQKQPVVIDLTEDDSDSDMYTDEEGASHHHLAIATKSADVQATVSRDGGMEAQSLSTRNLDANNVSINGGLVPRKDSDASERDIDKSSNLSWACTAFKTPQAIAACQHKPPQSAQPEEPPFGSFKSPSTKRAHIVQTAIDYRVSAGSHTTIVANNSGDELDDTDSLSTTLFVSPNRNHAGNTALDSDIPWEVFSDFLTIQRADFSSGLDFLQACEKLRRKVLITWNLQFTEKFTQVLFINAMRSFNPLLANALRRANLEGRLEFKQLKRVIRRSGSMTDDIMIGRQTWGEWKAELLPTSGVDYEEELGG